MDEVTEYMLLYWHLRWKYEGVKTVDDNSLFIVNIEDLKQFRIKKRTEKNSLSGSASLDYCSIGRNRKRFLRNNPELVVDGKTKWKQLKESLNEFGWVKEKPLILRLSARCNFPKIRDGHHRIYAALEEGITQCPVEIRYD